jgi:hypothetical protein
MTENEIVSAHFSRELEEEFWEELLRGPVREGPAPKAFAAGAASSARGSGASPAVVAGQCEDGKTYHE